LRAPSTSASDPRASARTTGFPPRRRARTFGASPSPVSGVTKAEGQATSAYGVR
jgi:hypothetical protein